MGLKGLKECLCIVLGMRKWMTRQRHDCNPCTLNVMHFSVLFCTSSSYCKAVSSGNVAVVHGPMVRSFNWPTFQCRCCLDVDSCELFVKLPFSRCSVCLSIITISYPLPCVFVIVTFLYCHFFLTLNSIVKNWLLTCYASNDRIDYVQWRLPVNLA